jgi:ferric iron reductase protein FhuF
MADLDLKDFADEEDSNKKENTAFLLEKALNKTLQKIKETIGGNPTVLWTGNGYHIYQPVSRFILEKYETFYEFTKYVDKDLTSMFIQFAGNDGIPFIADVLALKLNMPDCKLLTNYATIRSKMQVLHLELMEVL